MTQLRIFLSHSSQDKAVADTFARALRGAGADVWYDEHNLGAGILRDEIMRELADRPVFIVLLSKAAFASSWVRDECEWAYNLYRRKPERLLLPVTAAPYDPDNFDRLLYLESLKRVEGAGNTPYPQAEAIERTLRLLELTPRGEALTPATPLSDESADDLVTRGKALVAQKQYAETIPLFERATRLAPDNWDAWFNLGEAHVELTQWQEALTAYEQAVTINPNEALGWTSKGAALYALHRFEEALAAFDRALALDSQAPNYWTQKAETLSRLKRNEEAQAAFDRALALDPKERVVWVLKAISLRALGREAEAQEADRHARELGG